MPPTRGDISCEDLEKGVADSSIADDSDGRNGFSGSTHQRSRSPSSSHCVGSSLDGYRSSGASQTEIAGVVSASKTCRASTAFDCSSDADVENGCPEIKVNLTEIEKDCRICHLSLEDSQESGVPIELGCSCKDDLAAAHKQCAEAWFKIKGNKTCEICGSTAKNVASVNEAELPEQWDDTSSNPPSAAPPAETRRFWQGHRFLNFLLACVVFAFVISWLFHFNVPG